MDNQHFDSFSQSLQFRGVSESLANSQAERHFLNGNILAEKGTESVFSARNCESHCHPDVVGCIRGHMDMQQPQEDDS